MTIELWLAFVVASCILLIIPGPTILTVVSYSIAHGKRANIPLVAGVALGDSTALLLSLAGLGAVLATSAWLFTAVKVIGGLYLIFLGIKLLLTKTSPFHGDDALNTDAIHMPSPLKLFANTWLVTALNPKGIIFFVAFLPQFIDKTTDVTTQLWILSFTFVALASINAILYAVFATSARKLLSTPAAQQRFNMGGGALLTLAGGWALTAQRT